jgi:hypothetical protein
MIASFLSKALVPIFVFALETHVCWRSWPGEHHHPILEYITLGKRAVAVLLEELLRIEIFSRRFSPTNEEEMISHQGCRIWSRENTVDHHGERHPEMAYRCAEGDVLAILINQNLSKTRGEK